MSLRTVLAEYRKPLTNGDVQVIEVLLGNPQRSAFMPASEVASRASVHESTVTRLAQKLGYAGYPAMREDLREDALDDHGLSSRLVQAATSQRHELGALVQNEAEALLRMPAYLSQDDLDDAARLALSAGRVFITGNSYSNAPQTYLERRLRRYGIVVVLLPDSPTDTAELLQSMSEGDLLICFALRRPPALLSKLLKLVQERNAKSIVIADVVGIQLRPMPDQVLAAPRGADDVFRTPIVPLMIAYALQLAMLHVDPERCAAALDRLDGVSSLLDAEGPANLYTNYVTDVLVGRGDRDD